MREMKFRVWDNGRKEWVHGPGDEVNLFGETILYGELLRRPDDTHVKLDDLNDMIALQFTGIKDKNGKEIFEGDIVRFLDGSYVSTENGIDTNEFMSVGKVEWCDERKGWDVTNREDVQTDECFDEYMEVIGNIYQNPELLKP